MRGSKRRGEGHSNSDGSWSYWFLMLKTWVLRLWGEDEVVNLFIWALKRIWCWTVLKLYNLAISQSSHPLPDLLLLHLPSPLSSLPANHNNSTHYCCYSRYFHVGEAGEHDIGWKKINFQPRFHFLCIHWMGYCNGFYLETTTSILRLESQLGRNINWIQFQVSPFKGNILVGSHLTLFCFQIENSISSERRREGNGV